MEVLDKDLERTLREGVYIVGFCAANKHVSSSRRLPFKGVIRNEVVALYTAHKTYQKTEAKKLNGPFRSGKYKERSNIGAVSLSRPIESESILFSHIRYLTSETRRILYQGSSRRKDNKKGACAIGLPRFDSTRYISVTSGLSNTSSFQAPSKKDKNKVKEAASTTDEGEKDSGTKSGGKVSLWLVVLAFLVPNIPFARSCVLQRKKGGKKSGRKDEMKGGMSAKGKEKEVGSWTTGEVTAQVSLLEKLTFYFTLRSFKWT
jgi:hypothetical protein